ncbi:MAG: GGDEF domain-containing protein [Solirubrobacteraceae bacterium]|nr:GGDEF domain-containing protein [Solirubrobacteraceae bacterium]
MLGMENAGLARRSWPYSLCLLGVAIVVAIGRLTTGDLEEVGFYSLLLLAVLSLGGVVLVLVLRERITGVMYFLMACGGASLATFALLVDDPDVPWQVVYIWSGIGLNVVLSQKRWVVLYAAIVAAQYGAVLVIQDRPEPATSLFMVLATLALASAVIQIVLAVLRETLLDLQRQATTDPLTGVLNRRACDDLLVECQAKARRTEETFGLLTLDIDHFKAINDEHGHAVGDRVLVDFAHVVQEELRLTDGFARMGGEEFLAVLRPADTDAMAAAAERIRERVAGQRPQVPHYTVSIGAVLGDGSQPTDDLLQAADEAMYRAKAGGRDRVVLAAVLTSV